MFKSLFFINLVLSLPIYAFADPLDVEKCKGISNQQQRLDCYDELHGYVETSKINSQSIAQDLDETESPIIQHQRRRVFSIQPHRASYFMPFSFNDSRTPIDAIIPRENNNTFDNIEAKFQLSLKLNLWQDVLGSDAQLMAAFTQKSFWQMYNTELSSPFRETNYEPEVFLTKGMDIDILGLKLVNSSIGFVHQSNGRSSLFSRSWNRAYLNFALSKDNFTLSLKPWVRISEDFEDDDNPDISDFLGHYEIAMLYKLNDSDFTLMIRNINGNEHQETYQLGWTFPINKDLNLYLEYFHGYGESMIDYNFKSKTIGIGFSINDWLE